MTEIGKTERMPAAVRTARFILTLEVAFGLVGIAVLLIGVGLASFSVPYLLVLLWAASVPALMGWLLSRWTSRRKYVRWGAVALEVVAAGAYLAMKAVDGDLRWLTIFSPSTLLPLVVVVSLLTPAAGRWFDR